MAVNGPRKTYKTALWEQILHKHFVSQPVTQWMLQLQDLKRETNFETESGDFELNQYSQ